MRKAHIARAAGYKQVGGRVDDRDAAHEKDMRAAYYKKESAEVCLSCTMKKCTGKCDKIAAVEREIVNPEFHRHTRGFSGRGKKYEYNGEMLSMEQIAISCGVGSKTIRDRLRRGMTREQATQPVARGKGGK